MLPLHRMQSVQFISRRCAAFIVNGVPKDEARKWLYTDLRYRMPPNRIPFDLLVEVGEEEFEAEIERAHEQIEAFATALSTGWQAWARIHL